MKHRSVLVTAPSRLHFGMFSFGQPDERQFGGVGAMIDKPGMRLRIATAEQFNVAGPLAERVTTFAQQVFNRLNLVRPPTCRIELLDTPPEHVGLGVGTQLGLSVAAGLNAFLGEPPLTPPLLALLARRAERSAIGTHGFVQGCLLVEAGKMNRHELSPLMAQVPLPTDWRFVLIVPKSEQGIHGADEKLAFRELPPVPYEVTDELHRLAYEELVPAADEADVNRFSVALQQFGQLAGSCFAKFQQGVFATERLQHLVQRIHAQGVQGVGQSSWGPTIFALVANETAAQNLVQFLSELPEARESDLVIAAPNNSGARIEAE